MTHVAVYGTLKAGEGNHRLLEGSTFHGRGVTAKPYAMKDGGFPVVLDSNEGHPVAVEVYEVTDEIFRRLDALEGYPEMYTRNEVTVDMEDTGVHHTAWMYIGNPGWFRGRPDMVPENGVYNWTRQERRV